LTGRREQLQRAQPRPPPGGIFVGPQQPIGRTGGHVRPPAMLSGGRTLAFPLAGAALSGFMALVIGAVEPVTELECSRAAGEAVCVLRQHTLLVTREPVEFRLAEITADIVRPKRGSSSLALATAAGPLPLDSPVRGPAAYEIERAIKNFAADPTAAHTYVRAGFSPAFFLYAAPLLALVMLGPVWGLGGRLIVSVTRDQVSVRRDRWLRRGRPLELPRSPGGTVRFTATRGHGRYKRQGDLVAEIDGKSTIVVKAGFYGVLDRIARDLDDRLRSC
jgi:hypothetical protein